MILYLYSDFEVLCYSVLTHLDNSLSLEMILAGNIVNWFL